MAAIDALAGAVSLAEGFAAGGRSSIVLTMATRSTPETAAEEERLRAHVADIPCWIQQAECFYVDSAMTPLVSSAGAVVPDSAGLEPHDLPAPYGFLLIGGGATLCHMQDSGVQGEISAEAFSAFLWATFGGQVYVQRFELSPSQWLLLDATSVQFGNPLPRPARVKDQAYSSRLVIPGGRPDATHSSVEIPIGRPEVRELLDAPESQASDATIRWLVACWRLMGQTVVEVARETPSRQQRRQLERKNVPLRPVSIIKLRRKGSRRGDAAVNWSHRWIVRGHWRQQRCKDENGAWTTRPVFIHPYIKGPESTPLLTRQHVNHLVR